MISEERDSENEIQLKKKYVNVITGDGSGIGIGSGSGRGGAGVMTGVFADMKMWENPEEVSLESSKSKQAVGAAEIAVIIGGFISTLGVVVLKMWRM